MKQILVLFSYFVLLQGQLFGQGTIVVNPFPIPLRLEFTGNAATTATSGLTDFVPARSSSSVVTVGAGRVRIGNSPIAAYAGATITLSGASGGSSAAVKIYIGTDGAVKVEVASTVTLGSSTCSGCTFSSVASPDFADTNLTGWPIATITITAGAFNNDLVDERRFPSIQPVVCGAGATCSMANGILTIAPDTATMQSLNNEQDATPLQLTPSGGSGTAYTATPTPNRCVSSQPATGSRWEFTPDVNSGSNPTLACGSQAALNIQELINGTPTNVASGRLKAGVPYTLKKLSSAWLVVPQEAVPAQATALAANGTNCSAGNYPLGVDASGNAESCTAAGGSTKVDYQKQATAVTGDATDKTLFTTTVTGGTMGSGGCLEIYAIVKRTSGTDTVDYDLKWGATNFTIGSVGGGAYRRMSFWVCNDPGSTTAQQVTGPDELSSESGAGAGAVNPTTTQSTTAAENTGNNITLTLTGNFPNTSQVTPVFWLVKTVK